MEKKLSSSPSFKQVLESKNQFEMEPQHAKIASPRQNVQVIDVSEVDISVSGSVNSSENGNYYPSVLIADDDMVQLNGLIGQVKYVKGPDGNYQICECAHSGK